MKIVICDDSIEDLCGMEKLLLKYKELHTNVVFEVDKYSDASRLYGKINKSGFADIYILDMLMDMKSGIEIGNHIRSMDDKSVIIYITSSEDFALDAYNVRAIRYLLKPVYEGQFFEAMDYALSYISMKNDAVYLVKTKDGLVSLPYSQIEYIESSSRMLYIYLTDGKLVQSIFLRKSFDEEMKELLANDSFIQIHKLFIVNLRYVRKMERSDMVMESLKSLPISKKRIAEVKKEYLLFVSKLYR